MNFLQPSLLTACGSDNDGQMNGRQSCASLEEEEDFA